MACILSTKNVAFAFVTNAGGVRAEAAMQDAFAQVAALLGGT